MRRSTQVSQSDGFRDERVVGGDGVVVRERTRWVSPGRVIGGLVGVGLIAFGGVVVVRAGIDGSLNIPLVSVLGITNSAIVGLAELIAGLLIILAATDEAERPFLTFIGALALIAGIIGLATSGDIRTNIGFDNTTCWFFIIWGTVAAIAGMIPAVLRSHRDVSEPTL